MQKLKIFLMVVFLTILSACVMPTSNVVVASGTNWADYHSFAVWTFRDGGKAANAGDIASRAIESAFLLKGYKIIPISKVRETLQVEVTLTQDSALDSGLLNSAALKQLKNEIQVDGIITGSVNDSWCDPMWTPSCWIESSFQIIDTRTGELIVSANVSDDGWSLQRAAKQMAEKMVAKLTTLPNKGKH